MDFSPILVVDELTDLRTKLTQSLNRAGFGAESVANGSEALNKIESTKYSLVITDEQIPESGGVAVLSKIKKISPQIPVIIMTANGTVHNAVEAMQAGASDYLLKPFSMEILNKTVKKILELQNGNGQKRDMREKHDDNKSDKRIITNNIKFKDILSQAKGIASSIATVLIQGESGTGKELLAAYVHRHSLHPEAPYIAVNCAALPDTLAESELFGHEKGSFTGAVGRKIGKFELAKQGTVVLDEISEMPLPLQAKLLRVLQEKEIDRIGGNRPVHVDARVIAISNIDLKNAVKEGKFREDLYYRINVIPLTLPPLRERKEDIEILAKHFLEKFTKANKKEINDIDDIAMDKLLNSNWKGNVRELENVIERAVLICTGQTILAEHLLLDVSDSENASAEPLAINRGCTVRQMEKKLIFHTLEEVDDNRTRAAELLGISIRTLRNKLNEYKEENRANRTVG